MQFADGLNATQVPLQVLRNIVEVIQSMLRDTLGSSHSLRFPHLSGYERAFFESLLRHVAAMLLAARREAAAIISELRHVRHLT